MKNKLKLKLNIFSWGFCASGVWCHIPEEWSSQLYHCKNQKRHTLFVLCIGNFILIPSHFYVAYLTKGTVSVNPFLRVMLSLRKWFCFWGIMWNPHLIYISRTSIMSWISETHTASCVLASCAELAQNVNIFYLFVSKYWHVSDIIYYIYKACLALTDISSIVDYFDNILVFQAHIWVVLHMHVLYEWVASQA